MVNMEKRVLRTGDEIRAINRNRKKVVYREKHPERTVRLATRDFLSKKETLTEIQRKEGGLLEELLENIRGILTAGDK